MRLSAVYKGLCVYIIFWSCNMEVEERNGTIYIEMTKYMGAVSKSINHMEADRKKMAFRF